MRTSTELLAEYSSLTADYAAWLGSQDRHREAEYRASLAAGEPDGPVFEACVWRLLSTWGIELAAEPQQAKGPDFRCVAGRESHFYVEATARQVGPFSKEMRVLDVPIPAGGSVKPWHAFHGKAWDKARQAAARPGAPVLLAYGSLHRWASDLILDCALLDEALGVKSSVWVDGPRAGQVDREAVGGGAFTDCPALAGILFLPTEATGRVMRAWAMEYTPVRGVINPSASAPFDPQLLPTVRWLTAADGG